MAKLVRSVPPLPQTERGAFCHIAVDAPGERLLYCNGNNVIWRDLAKLKEGKEAPDDIFCWKGHPRKTTCVAMSPNGQWVASGDIGGSLRLWGAKGDHLEKNEYRLWDGVLKDVSWSGDSTRIVAAGNGKERSAVALIWDTGSKTGEVGSHSKQINSISFRSQRPFRVVTGSEDMLVNFHAGPPFKFQGSHQAHTNFVNCVRFSPDGEWAVSGGSDSKLCLYTGKEGALEREFEKPEGISGSIWAAAWAADSARIATAGGDRMLRVWGREAGKQICAATVGKELDDMQVGVAWPKPEQIVSVCLDGRVLLWNVSAEALQLATAVHGMQGPLTCLARDAGAGALVYGGSDGYVAIAAPEQPPRRVKRGKGVQHVVAHSSAYTGPGEVWVIALDNKASRLSLETGEWVGDPIDVKEFVVAAKWMNTAETELVVATGTNGLHCYTQDGPKWSKPGFFPRRPSAMGSLPPGSSGTGCLAVALEKPEGGQTSFIENTTFDIMLYRVSDATEGGISEWCVVGKGHSHEVSALSFSPTGDFLASADTYNKIIVWNLKADPVVAFPVDLLMHTARVASLDWLPCGQRLVSGSLDCRVFVTDVHKPGKQIKIEEAHRGGVTAVVACGDGSIASVGHDGFLQVYSVDA